MEHACVTWLVFIKLLLRYTVFKVPVHYMYVLYLLLKKENPYDYGDGH